MSDPVCDRVRALIIEHGRTVCDEPRRCEALLRDYCGEQRREINLLVAALKERIPADLMGSTGGLPTAALLARLARRLEDNLSVTAEAAHWTVHCWAFALGTLTEVVPRSDPAASSTTPPASPAPTTYTHTAAAPSAAPRTGTQPAQPAAPGLAAPAHPPAPAPGPSPSPTPRASGAPQPSAPAGGVVRYSTFRRRYGALAIDATILFVVVSIAYAVTNDSGWVYYVVPWLYYALQESSSAEATIGKRVCKIAVTDLHGRKMSSWRATARFLAQYILSWMIVGLILPAFAKGQRSLTDRITKTQVVSHA